MQRCVINCNLLNRTSVCHIQQRKRLILGKICWLVFEIWFFWAKNEWQIGFNYIFVGAHVLICSKAKLTSVQKGCFFSRKYDLARSYFKFAHIRRRRWQNCQKAWSCSICIQITLLEVLWSITCPHEHFPIQLLTFFNPLSCVDTG